MLFDADQFSADLTAMLASSNQLAGVNVQRYRTMRLKPNVNWATLVTTLNASGKTGNGVIVLEPYARSKEVGISGAVFDWVFPVVSMEQPSVNDDPRVGDGRTAYKLAQLVIDVAHVHADDLYGTLLVDANAIEDETQFGLEGCVAKRSSFHIVGKSLRTDAVKTIQILQVSGPGSPVNMSTTTVGAQVYYTTDGSWPANSTTINPATNLFTGTPVTVAAGLTVRATGFLNGFNCSETRALIVT